MPFGDVVFEWSPPRAQFLFMLHTIKKRLAAEHERSGNLLADRLSSMGESIGDNAKRAAFKEEVLSVLRH